MKLLLYLAFKIIVLISSLLILGNSIADFQYIQDANLSVLILIVIGGLTLAINSYSSLRILLLFIEAIISTLRQKWKRSIKETIQ